MAISWGSWDYGNSSAGFRVGVSVSVSSVSHNSSSVTITTNWYVEAQYNVNDQMTLTYGGSIGGSTTTNLTTGSGGGYKLFASKSYTYNYSTYGSSPGTRTFSASLSGVYNGANPSKSVTVTLPARPYAKPAPPSGVAATRNSDSQATVTWVNHATAGEPYSSLLVQRMEWSGSSWGPWVNVGYASKSATSLVVTGLSANRKHHFRVRANNSVGVSAFVDSAQSVYMTPAAPSGVTSSLDSSGSTITTTWQDNAYTDAGVSFTIQRSVNGGVYADVVTGIPQGTLTWTDPTPGGGTNRYRVAAVQSVGSLSSAYAEGNTVSTIVAPLAPSTLAPNGEPVDFTRSVILTWKHVHGGDAAQQSAFQIEYSADGGGSWAQLNGTGTTSTAQSYTIPAYTLANGGTYLWRVRTQGIPSAGYGPFSASATMIGSSTPTATLTPLGASVVELPIPLEWAYNQDEGAPQSSWEAQILRAVDRALVDTASGSNTATSTVFSGTKLVDGQSYIARVRVQSADGLWSDWAEDGFTVDLLPPAAVLVEGTFDPETGTVVLSLSEIPDGTSVAVDHVTVERRVAGGEWSTLIEGLTLPTDFLDVIPLTAGENTYRVTSVSATPTYRVNDDVVVTADPQGWVFVNYGNDYTTVLRFHTEPKISEKAEREQALVKLLGRAKPVALYGEGTTREVSVAGVLLHDDAQDAPDSPPVDWELAGHEAEIVCFRDFTGRRFFGQISGVSTADTAPGEATVAFSVEETDHTEAAGFAPDLPPVGSEAVIDGGDPLTTNTTTLDGGNA